MILIKNWILGLLFSFFLVFLFFLNPRSGRSNYLFGAKNIAKEISLKQDTAIEHRKRNALTAELPDTNFTWEKYAAFLTKISDTSKYTVLPLNEFRTTFNNNKIVIGLRHDVDNDLNVAYQFSQIESKLGFRSTYFILHTAPYYLANSNNMAIHSESILPVLKTMQNDKKFEIGWHNDLVTLQVIYNINPVTFLHNELNWLRSNGINIIGTAAHGSNYCKVYHYMNFYFFEECTYPIVPNRENNISVPIGVINIPIMKGRLSDFDLKYEAYFLNNNKAFSDATITNGIRWNIGMLDLKQLHAGDRVIILLHPIHWHKASVYANIESFRITGQKSSSIDPIKSIISVEMPYGTSKDSLLAVFELSPGAEAKVLGKMQISGSTLNNFNDPLTYTVFAENRDIRKDWIVNVIIGKNTACNFESFVIPGFTKAVTISTLQKTIFIKVNENADLAHLPVQFELSSGAGAWIGSDKQFSNEGTIDFSNSVQYKVLAEDGISSCLWTVTVQKGQNLANFLTFNIPGQTGPTKIDTLNNSIYAEISNNGLISSLRPSFDLSDNANAWIGKNKQLSDVSIVDFSEPVIYDVFSKDSTSIKKWKVTVLQTTLSSKGEKAPATRLSVYPNPSTGMIHLQFHDIQAFPTKLDIYNALGVKVYTELISKTGDFITDADLTKLPAGVYIVKYSDKDKPLLFIISVH